MSFWKSKKHKARKPHVCEFCGKKIGIGEEYSRENGKHEGEFHDYCLCLRCLYVIERLEISEYTFSFFDFISENELISCPACGSYKQRDRHYSVDIMNCEYVCGSCGEKWAEDLSIEGLKEIIRRTSS